VGNQKTEIIKAITKAVERKVKGNSKVWPEASADTDPPITVYLAPKGDRLVGFVKFAQSVKTGSSAGRDIIDDQEIDAGEVSIALPAGMRFGTGDDNAATQAILAALKKDPIKAIRGLDAVLQEIPAKSKPAVKASGFQDEPDDTWESTHPVTATLPQVLERLRNP